MADEGYKTIRILKNLQYNPVTNHVRLIREARGVTQEDLANKSGVSQNSISRIETGERKPRKSTLAKLAKALEVEDPEVLIGEVPEVLTFEEILDWDPEQRRKLFELWRETGEYTPFIQHLQEHYEQDIKGRMDAPENTEAADARLEAVLMLGYAMGYSEGRKHRGEGEDGT